jgi:hypothetical protein
MVQLFFDKPIPFLPSKISQDRLGRDGEWRKEKRGK